MKILNSIENIKEVYTTNGSMPVRVHCSDLNDYICKYDKDTMKLFNEYIAAKFLKIWKIPVPPTVFVNINESHIPSEFISGRLQPQYFKKTCFGSLHLSYASEVTKFFKSFVNSPTEITKIINKKDFLKIALFDLWLANEDRNCNNHNLLLNPVHDGYQFVAIDHTELFNSRAHMHGLSQMTENDSILLAGYTEMILGSKQKAFKYVPDLIKEYYLCVKRCKKVFSDIVSEVPAEWNIDREVLDEKIAKIIFEKDWLIETEHNFKNYLEIAYLNK